MLYGSKIRILTLYSMTNPVPVDECWMGRLPSPYPEYLKHSIGNVPPSMHQVKSYVP